MSADHDFSCHIGRNPKQKHHRQSRRKSRHKIDRSSYQIGSPDHFWNNGKHPSYHQKQWRTRRVNHLQFVRGRYKLSTIPQTGGGFHGKGIYNGGNNSHQNAQYGIKRFKLVHIKGCNF